MPTSMPSALAGSTSRGAEQRLEAEAALAAHDAAVPCARTWTAISTTRIVPMITPFAFASQASSAIETKK